MKRKILRGLSILLFLGSLLSFGAVVTAKGGGFLDLSGMALGVFGAISLLLITLSLFLWQTDDPQGRPRKLILWAAALLVIAFGVFGHAVYRSGSTVLTEASLEAVVSETEDGMLLVRPTEKKGELGERTTIRIPTQGVSMAEPPKPGDLIEVVYNGEIDRDGEDNVTLPKVFQITVLSPAP